MVAVAGCVLTAALVSFVLVGAERPAPQTPGEADAALVAPADLDGAAVTLAANAQVALIADAKSCRAPLAVMSMVRAPNTTGGLVRIRSGSYLSPPFRLGDTPERVAIPFPTAYPSGRGTITVEGNATGVLIALRPTWSAPSLAGSRVINLVWATDKPCGK